MPPIFQPELAATAICDAIEHPTREVFVAAPTIAAIQLHKVVPGLLDRYLGRSGYDAQMTAEPERPNRPDNLFEPIDLDHGAHGRFDDVAIDDRPLPAPIAHPVGAVVAASAVAGAAAGLALAARRIRR